MATLVLSPALSITAAPRPGEAARPLVRPVGGSWSEASRIRLGRTEPLPPAPSESEQQAIADAGESVIP